MADESFILTLVGQLDENSTRNNVETVLKKLNQSLQNNSLTKIKVFDKDELEKQGNAYITGVEDIKNKISELFNGSIKINKIFDDNGEIEKFKATIIDATTVLKEFNFERAKFTDGTSGFVLNSGTNVGNTNSIVSEFNNVSTSVNSAKNNVKVFTKESEDALNELGLKITKTSISLSNIGNTAEKSVKSIQNVLNGAKKITIGEGDNQRTIRGFDTIEDFLNRYQKFANGFKGNPILNLNVDDNGKLQGFTATLGTTEGAVKNLTFRLRELKDEEETFFQYQGANVSDSTFDRQLNAITKLEEKYNNFKSKLSDGVSFKFIDTTDTINKLKVVEDVISQLKNNVGLNNIVDIENFEKSLDVIISTANEAEKVEKKRQTETDKTTKAIDRQNKQLETTRVLLKSWEETKVNPDSASFVGNSDKLEGVKEKLKEVIKLRDDLGKRNANREIISQSEINNLTVGLSELRLMMSEARKESGQSLDRNESMARVSKEIDVLNSKLDADIAKWKNMGVYAGQFKKDVEDLQTTLTQKDNSDNYIIDSTQKVRDLSKEVTILGNKALELQRNIKGTKADISDPASKLGQGIDLANSKLDAYIAKWKNMGVYTGKILSDAEILKSKLGKDFEGNNLVKSKTELDLINNQIKILNNNASELQKKDDGSFAKTLESQRKYIELATESLKRYKKEVTDSNSMNPLKGEDLQKAINGIDYVEARLNALRNRNVKHNEIVDVKLINEYEIKLAELKNEIDGYYDSQRKLKLSDDVIKSVDLYREKLATLEQRYSEMIQKSDSFKQSFESVKNSLANVKTPEELQAWEQSFKKMQEAAKQTGMTMRNELRTEEISQKVALLRQQIEAYEQSNSRAANIYATSFAKLKQELDAVANNGDLKKIQNEFRSLKLTVKQAGVEGKTFGQRMQEAFQRMSRYFGITSLMMYTVRTIREMITNVKELDTQMVRLKRVTEETDETYSKMFDNAVASAKKLNASVADIVEATADFSKLGFDSSAAANLAEIATMYANVGELDVSSATESLVSTINGFKDLDADDAMKIIDVFDNIGKIVA